ncbi:MAG: hypothetical protein ACPG4X_22440 [Pikeienuella sp.]
MTYSSHRVRYRDAAPCPDCSTVTGGQGAFIQKPQIGGAGAPIAAGPGGGQSSCDVATGELLASEWFDFVRSAV